MIKKENCSGVPENENKPLADNMYFETLTIKDPKKVSSFYLHHNDPILWESPKFDAMSCQSMENTLVNNRRASMGSRMKCSLGSKAAKTAAAMKDVDIDIDPERDASSMKVSDRL